MFISIYFFSKNYIWVIIVNGKIKLNDYLAAQSSIYTIHSLSVFIIFAHRCRIFSKYPTPDINGRQRSHYIFRLQNPLRRRQPHIIHITPNRHLNRFGKCLKNRFYFMVFIRAFRLDIEVTTRRIAE